MDLLLFYVELDGMDGDVVFLEMLIYYQLIVEMVNLYLVLVNVVDFCG